MKIADLKPERKNSWEIGLDFRTFNNRLFAYDLATDELQHFESNINGFSHITSNFLQYIMED